MGIAVSNGCGLGKPRPRTQIACGDEYGLIPFGVEITVYDKLFGLRTCLW
ncbi:MAG: hypothetical protein LBR54_00650 [Oscillospiraceae bacterium]|jgi:hypothetical protein|nr:hypothetical protein [Oscillospiraceae bacterium]